MVSNDPGAAVRRADQMLAGPDLFGDDRSTVLRLRARSRLLLRLASAAVDDYGAALAAAVSNECKVEATIGLAAALAYTGEHRRGLEVLEAIEREPTAALGSRRWAQMALLAHRLDEPERAFAAWERALAYDGLDDDYQADVRCNRGVAFGYSERFAEALADFEWAAQVYRRSGQAHALADVTQNRGWIESLRGDIPAALAHFSDADEWYRRAGVPEERRYPDECSALIEAGLFSEAARRSRASAVHLEASGDAADAAELFVVAAEAYLAAGDIEAARTAAGRAAACFGNDVRSAWSARSEAVSLLASMPTSADNEAVDAVLVVVERLRRGGLSGIADDLLLGAANASTPPPPALLALVASLPPRRLTLRRRVARLRVLAAGAQADGRHDEACRLARHALGLVARRSGDLGDSELRAHTSHLRTGLDDVLLAPALLARRPWNLLATMARIELPSARLGHLRPPDDPDLGVLLAELRSARRRAEADGEGSAWSDVRLVESRIARHARARPGDDHQTAKPLQRRAILEALAGRSLIAYAVTSTRVVQVVVSERGQECREVAGRSEVMTAIAAVRRTLSRAAGGDETGRRRVEGDVTRLTDLLAIDTSETASSLVVSAPGDLALAPWGVIGAMAGRPIEVTPWLGLLVRSGTRGPNASLPPPTRVLAVVGPGIAGASDEVAMLRSVYGDDRCRVATTADEVLHSLPRCDVAHFVCHGHAQPENPRFSSLSLADGPWFAHDFERATRLPSTIVLAACSSAASGRQSGDELVGIVPTLLSLGASAVIASPVAITDDHQTVDLMAALHRALASGAAPALGLAQAFQSVEGAAVARPLTCFGV